MSNQDQDQSEDEGIKIEHLFATVKDMRDHFKYVIYRGLPADMMEQAIDTAVLNHKRYGLGFSGIEEPEPEAEPMPEPGKDMPW